MCICLIVWRLNKSKNNSSMVKRNNLWREKGSSIHSLLSFLHSRSLFIHSLLFLFIHRLPFQSSINTSPPADKQDWKEKRKTKTYLDLIINHLEKCCFFKRLMLSALTTFLKESNWNHNTGKSTPIQFSTKTRCNLIN